MSKHEEEVTGEVLEAKVIKSDDKGITIFLPVGNSKTGKISSTGKSIVKSMLTGEASHPVIKGEKFGITCLLYQSLK